MSGLVSVAIGLRQRWSGRDISDKLWFAIALLCIFVASFLAWRDEHLGAEEGMRELQHARMQLRLPTLTPLQHKLLRGLAKYQEQLGARKLIVGRDGSVATESPATRELTVTGINLAAEVYGGGYVLNDFEALLKH